jgi:hypothetical protein
VRRATDANGYYADGSPSFGITPLGKFLGGVADTVGKIWNIPNDIIGLSLAIIGGGHFDGFSNNAMVFTGSPLVTKFAQAITIGNVAIYGQGFDPADYGRSPYTPGFSMYTGYHEQGHTVQSQFLGPLFLPVYGLAELPHGVNPLETGADNYAGVHQPPPPGQ